MKKDKLYVFDENNVFVRVLVNPSQEEKEQYTNSLLNPSTRYLSKYPMERWEKEGNVIVVRDKSAISQMNIKREVQMSDVVKEVELQLKQVINTVKNQNLDLEAYKKENEKLKSKTAGKKLLILSLLINIIGIIAATYHFGLLK